MTNDMESFENRDLQCANEVAEMARLGKFETEFLIFGSAVQEADGNIYYYATTNREKLYRCIWKARREERYFMPVVCYMRRLQVPADLKDEWIARCKLELIQKMKLQYEHFLPKLQPLLHTPPNDQARALLAACQERIDGYFDDIKLQLFWGLVEQSYEAKILCSSSYQTFYTWHENVRQQMSDDPVYSDNITRVFYGFVYETPNGQRRTVIDAQQVDAVEKWYEKNRQGYVVAPIIKKQYAFKQFSEMAPLRQAFQKWLLAAESTTYLALVRQLKAMDGVIPAHSLQDISAVTAGNSYDEAAVAHFAGLWNYAKNV